MAAESRIKAIALTGTIGVHVGLVLAVVLGSLKACSSSANTKRPGDDKIIIEAGLAMKSKTTPGKKSSLPNKDISPKVKKPDAPKVATNPNAPVKPKDPKQPDPPPDQTDDAAKLIQQLAQNAQTGDTNGNPDSTDDTNQKGDPNGSVYGSLDHAVGDEYIGDLHDRIGYQFRPPGTIPQNVDMVAILCVRLDESGKIVDWKLNPPSDDPTYGATFNSAVGAQMKDTLDHRNDAPKGPVPAKWKSKLVEGFDGCFAMHSQPQHS